jgi:hypothetical protein
VAWSNGGQGVVCERRERAHPAPNDRRVVSWTRRTGCTPVERHICESAQRDARKGARERGTKLSERTGRELSHARQMPQTSSSVVHVQLATACQFLMVTFMPQFVPQLAGGIRRRIVRARDSLAARRDCSGSVSAASTKCFAVNARNARINSNTRIAEIRGVSFRWRSRPSVSARIPFPLGSPFSKDARVNHEHHG